MKTQGFNLEDTHITHPDRVGRLMGAMAVSVFVKKDVASTLKKFTPDYCRAALACSVFCLFLQHTENKQKTRACIQHARSSSAWHCLFELRHACASNSASFAAATDSCLAFLFGFNVTLSGSDQLRVSPDQRSGCSALAA